MTLPKRSFEPVIDAQAKFLVLGSLPGDASLAAFEYYAHPRNLFWPFMEDIFSIARSLPYEQRLQALLQRRIALWDVVKSGVREGSLDSAIRGETVNDFSTLLARHPQLQRIGFNGQKAQQLFARAHRAGAIAVPAACQCVVLPSTSPAHAARTRADKLRAWREFFER